MEDKKLNEVTTVNSGTLANVKTFLAVMKDGTIQQMSKEDLASVVGGLLGIDNAIKIKGTLEVGTDLNSINTVGIFKMNGAYKNSPFGASWGCLIIPPATAANLPQILIEVTSISFNIYARRDFSYNWRKINMT